MTLGPCKGVKGIPTKEYWVWRVWEMDKKLGTTTMGEIVWTYVLNHGDSNGKKEIGT